jgi:hypothetical protein
MNEVVPRPKKYFKVLEALDPKIWRNLDEFRQELIQKIGPNHGLPMWEQWCWAPTPMFGVFFVRNFRLRQHLTQDQMTLAQLLIVVAQWRLGQGIYRFDPDLYESLISTPVGKIPYDAIFRLPEYCVYLETPGHMIPLEDVEVVSPGAFVFLSDRSDTGEKFLCIALDVDTTMGPTVILYEILLVSGKTLMECVELSFGRVIADNPNKTLRDLNLPTPEKLTSYLEPVISLVLYICSEEPDFGGENLPSRATSRRIRGKERFFPPDRPPVWDVGVRLGSAIRTYQKHREDDSGSSETQNKKRPHLRRAHWHSFWTGQRTEGSPGTKLVVKWVPPVPVNLGEIDIGQLPSVIHNVKNEGSIGG